MNFEHDLQVLVSLEKSHGFDIAKMHPRSAEVEEVARNDYRILEVSSFVELADKVESIEQHNQFH